MFAVWQAVGLLASVCLWGVSAFGVGRAEVRLQQSADPCQALRDRSGPRPGGKGPGLQHPGWGPSDPAEGETTRHFFWLNVGLGDRGPVLFFGGVGLCHVLFLIEPFWLLLVRHEKGPGGDVCRKMPEGWKVGWF